MRHRTAALYLNSSTPLCRAFCFIPSSKFSHGETYNLLKFAGFRFLTVGLNFLISILFIKLGWVRPHMKGTFIAAFTGATVLFVGVPLVQTMYGSDGIPYLLVYFFANCVFIWTVGIFNIQLDGACRGMTEEPKIFSIRGLKDAALAAFDGLPYRFDRCPPVDSRPPSSSLSQRIQSVN